MLKRTLFLNFTRQAANFQGISSSSSYEHYFTKTNNDENTRTYLSKRTSLENLHLVVYYQIKKCSFEPFVFFFFFFFFVQNTGSQLCWNFFFSFLNTNQECELCTNRSATQTDLLLNLNSMTVKFDATIDLQYDPARLNVMWWMNRKWFTLHIGNTNSSSSFTWYISINEIKEFKETSQQLISVS